MVEVMYIPGEGVGRGAAGNFKNIKEGQKYMGGGWKQCVVVLWRAPQRLSETVQGQDLGVKLFWELRDRQAFVQALSFTVFSQET